VRRENKVLLNRSEKRTRGGEEAIETRGKSRTREIATAEVVGKNPDKLKKSIIAITY